MSFARSSTGRSIRRTCGSPTVRAIWMGWQLWSRRRWTIPSWTEPPPVGRRTETSGCETCPLHDHDDRAQVTRPVVREGDFCQRPRPVQRRIHRPCYRSTTRGRYMRRHGKRSRPAGTSVHQQDHGKSAATNATHRDKYQVSVLQAAALKTARGRNAPPGFESLALRNHQHKAPPTSENAKRRCS